MTFNNLVSVGNPPEILEPLLDMLVVAPEEAHLECDIAPGDPPAEIHWYKENKEIYRTKRMSMSYHKELASLVIPKTDVRDGGWYRCEAVNRLGRVETQCTLVVQSK